MTLTYDPNAGASNKGQGTLEVDPISRIEGHLGVKLDVVDGFVASAEVHGNLWRGFENFLIGRDVNDAITFTQRICGVCPVPHGQASTFAADAVLGYNDNFQTWIRPEEGGLWPGDNGITAPVATPDNKGIPAKAVHVRNLVLSAEFLMSNITHSYHLAAPSYIQGPNIPPWTPYYDNSFYHPLLQATGKGIGTAAASNANQPAIPGATLPVNVQGYSKDLWSAVIKQYVKALRIRRLTFEAGALFAGRMPMTSCFVAGGVTTNQNEDLTAKCGKYRTMMQEIGEFIVKEFVPLFLALGALYPEYDNVNNDAKAGALGLGDCLGYGAGCKNYLAWGAFPQADGTLGVARGFKVGLAGAVSPITSALVKANLREHITYSRYAAASSTTDNAGATNAPGVTDPYTENRTIPERADAAKYSWLKAPRWNNAPMEVGPMARMFVSGFYQDNVDLKVSMATAGLPAGLKGYDYYAKTVGADTGLDPAMVSADLAVAVVREGLATLKFNADLSGFGFGTGAQDWIVWQGATDATHLDVDALNQAQIELAYGLGSAVILGALADWIYNLKAGASIIDRLRARPLESLVLIQRMIGGFTKTTGTGALTWAGGGWVQQLDDATGGTYTKKTVSPGTVSGFGATEAPRGALMHMCTVTAGKIVRYQCIVPTTWNAAPMDANSVHGPMEQAMEGVPYSNQRTAATGGAGTAVSAGGGVEALRVAQSFDPCIACAVH